MITLRDLAEEDRDRLLVWRNQSEIRQWMYTDHVISREEHDDWFSAVLVDASRKYWVIELDDAPVGVVNLTGLAVDDTSCSFGIYIGESHARGSGAGLAGLFAALRYAFRICGVARVDAEVLKANDKGLSLYERLGLRDIGAVEGLGRQVDARRMSITGEEWRDLQQTLEADVRARGLAT